MSKKRLGYSLSYLFQERSIYTKDERDYFFIHLAFPLHGICIRWYIVNSQYNLNTSVHSAVNSVFYLLICSYLTEPVLFAAQVLDF